MNEDRQVFVILKFNKAKKLPENGCTWICDAFLRNTLQI